MADIKKYLGQEGTQALINQVKAEDAKNLQAAKDYADSKASNYEAAGSVATAVETINQSIAGVQGEVDAVEQALATEESRAKAAEEANAAAAKKAQDEVDALELVVQNIQENAYDDTELRGLISGLDTNKADKTQVATDIAAAVKVETDARVEAVQGVQNAVDTLSGTHATDKKALEDAIALKADQTALDAVSGVANAAVKQTDYDVKVKALEDEDARIVGLVEAEAERAAEAEGALGDRLTDVEAFFKLAEGEQLDTALDTLVEIQEYINNEGAAADQMVLDIAANTKAIEDMDAAYKLADGTLQGNINDLSGTVATKADQSALDEAVEALEGADSAMDARIGAIEDKFKDGEGSVADQIADAKQEAIDAAATDATTKAGQALTDAKAYTDEKDTAMNTRVQALEAVDHEHANKDLLDTYTQTEEDLADAVAKKHAHENKADLDSITAELIAKWNAAEQNAKDYADGLNTAMTSKVDGIDGRVTANADAIALKASQADLTALTERVTTAETNISSNASAIAALQPFTSDEIDALFA